MLVTSLATAGTVFTLNIYKSGEKEVPVPLMIQKIFFDVIAKILLINIKRSKSLKLMMHEYATKKQKQSQDISKNYYKKINNDQLLKDHECTKQLNTNEDYIQMNSHQHDHRVGLDTISNKILLKASPLIMPIRMNSDRHIHRLNLSNTSLNSANNDSTFTSIPSKKIHQMNDYSFRPLISNHCNQEFKKFGSGKIHRSTKKTKLERNFTLSTGVSYPFVKSNKIIDDQKHLVKLINKLNENMEAKEIKGIMQESKQDIRNQWIQLAKVIDTLLFYLFFISTCLMIYFLVRDLPNAKIF